MYRGNGQQRARVRRLDRRPDVRLGQISGQAAAKAELFWNTGDTSGLNFFFDFDRSSLRGQVVDSLFKGERVRAKDFSLTPMKGDCAGSPLIRARMTGPLGL